ncbi:MAG: beta-ketoacyl synthase N-terminal-like domain-containing protein [Candidatus Methylumidiphilus sp.]
MSEKIVVTGIGVVSALGSQVDAAAEALAAQACGVRQNAQHGATRLHGAAQGFNAGEYVNANKARRMDPINVFTIAAGRQALTQAELPPELARTCGLLVGTGFSGLRSVVEHQKKFLRDGIVGLSPIHFPNTVYNASAGMAAIELGVAGPNTTVTGVDVSGEQAVLYAAMMLRQGMAERVLVIGADELSQALAEGFGDLLLLDADAENPACPFARRRSGFNLAEGAAALLLETASAAAARGATVLGTIEGIGLHASACDPYSHDLSPAAGAAAIHQALQRAGRELSDIDWVSSPANGSRTLDAADIQLWTSVLGEASAKVTAIKAYTGEFAASGVLRLALALACGRQGVIPAMDAAQDYDPAIRPLLNLATRRGQPPRFLHHGTGVGGSQIALVVDCAA